MKASAWAGAQPEEQDDMTTPFPPPPQAITSPESALRAIYALASVPNALHTPHAIQLFDRISTVAKTGLTCVPAAPFLPKALVTSPYMALRVIELEASIEGRHYLPSEWVRASAAAGLACAPIAPELTPAQRVADKLLVRCIAYEAELTSNFKEYVGVNADPEDYAHENPLAADLMGLRALLDPLRPPPPPTLEEALTLLSMARKKGMDAMAQDVDALLARRVPE